MLILMGLLSLLLVVDGVRGATTTGPLSDQCAALGGVFIKTYTNSGGASVGASSICFFQGPSPGQEAAISFGSFGFYYFEFCSCVTASSFSTGTFLVGADNCLVATCTSPVNDHFWTVGYSTLPAASCTASGVYSAACIYTGVTTSTQTQTRISFLTVFDLTSQTTTLVLTSTTTESSSVTVTTTSFLSETQTTSATVTTSVLISVVETTTRTLDSRTRTASTQTLTTTSNLASTDYVTLTSVIKTSTTTTRTKDATAVLTFLSVSCPLQSTSTTYETVTLTPLTPVTVTRCTTRTRSLTLTQTIKEPQLTVVTESTRTLVQRCTTTTTSVTKATGLCGHRDGRITRITDTCAVAQDLLAVKLAVPNAGADCVCRQLGLQVYSPPLFKSLQDIEGLRKLQELAEPLKELCGVSEAWIESALKEADVGEGSDHGKRCLVLSSLEGGGVAVQPRDCSRELYVLCTTTSLASN